MLSYLGKISDISKDDELMDYTFDYQVGLDAVTADPHLQEKKVMAVSLGTLLNWNTWQEASATSSNTSSKKAEICSQLGMYLNHYFGELFSTPSEDERFKLHEELLSQPGGTGQSPVDKKTLGLLQERNKGVQRECLESLDTVIKGIPSNERGTMRQLAVESLVLECHRLIKPPRIKPEPVVRYMIVCVQYRLTIKYVVGISDYQRVHIVCGAYIRKNIKQKPRRKAGMASTFTRASTTGTFSSHTFDTNHTIGERSIHVSDYHKQGDGYESDKTVGETCFTPESSVVDPEDWKGSTTHKSYYA